MAKWRSPFKATSRETCAFKKKGSWAAGYHTGVDRVCDSNTALVAPCNCTVKRNEYSDSYGNFVVLLTNDGKSILMAHMKSKSSLKVGAKITAGTSIGTMGNTGNSSGAHLHIEIQNSKTWAYNKNLLNPNDYIDWNCFSNSSPASTGSFVSAKKWQNGTTKETVFKLNNLTDDIGYLSVKESAECYGKKGNGYIIVYDLDGTNKHKAGFVEYAGGVSSVPSGGKTYKNGSSSETVYADTAKKTVVGSLDKYETCVCLGKVDGMYLVVYEVNSTSNYKCGFVVYDGGVE
uniref:M23 family metallopeptidase n=1 Tax=Eubacterium sp. TaxID=142586 RepID=UPI0020462E9F|nr:MAG TPA: peptidase [Bacteriophage sp.]